MAGASRRLRPGPGSLPADEAERLFATVDETGHVDEERSRAEHERRSSGRSAVEVDPLDPEADPSGADAERRANRRAVVAVVVAVSLVVLVQVAFAFVRRGSASALSEDVSVASVSSAMRLGVEWGDGFTQFPEDFVVQEADEATGRIEVSVTSTGSHDVLDCLSRSQIQATALSVNALLNPDIDTVIYHVNVYVDEDGDLRADAGSPLSARAELTGFMTFVWTKETTEEGITFSCTISGVDEDMADELRDLVAGPIVLPAPDEDAPAGTTGASGGADGSGEDPLA